MFSSMSNIAVSLRRLGMLIGLFVVVHAHGATLYVSTSGSDSYPGTSSQPVRTIVRAYSLATAGTTIIVKAGTYTDYNSGWGIHLGKNGTASSPITLKSEVPGGAVIDGQNASDRNVGIYIDGTYNIVDGFEIKNGPKGGITIWANNNQILNCNIHNNGNPPSSSTYGMDGVYSDEVTSGNVYRANYIHHNGRSGSTLDHGLYLCGKNEVVLNNILLANSGNGLQVAGYTTVANLKVYNNVMAYNGANGIILWQYLNGVDIKNNIFYQNGHYAIGSYDGHGSGVNVDHNISYGNGYGHFSFRDGGSDFAFNLTSAVYSDPQLANTSSSTFDPHLKSGSPAIQSALNLYSTFTTDMAGTLRQSSGSWDSGVYKFGSTSSADTIPPTVSVTSPANGATLSGTASVTCNVADNVGVVSVQFQIDGANVGTADTSAPYSFALNTASYANGSHTLKAIAKDAAGNQTTSAAISVTISNSTADTTAPTVSITSPANGATLSGNAIVSCNAADNVGVATVQLQIDGSNVGSADTSTPYLFALNTASYANGSHTLKAIAKDAAGNQTTSAAISVTISNSTSGSGSTTVSVTASVPTAVLNGANGAFTFTRTGSTGSALAVNYSLGGTAVKWNDYYRAGTGDMPTTITIPAGSASYTMNILARDNQTKANPETVNLTLSPYPSYQVGSPPSATMNIVSNSTSGGSGGSTGSSGAPGITLQIAKTLGGGMKFTWNSVAGKIYRVASKGTLTSPWKDLSSNITATTNSTSWTDTIMSHTNQQFYTVYSTN
jgi:Bacterial Ig domain